jgi:hypothetical protein
MILGSGMNRITVRSGLLAWLLVVLGSGCASNPELTRAKLPEFTEGKSTLVEVVQRLGQPTFRFKDASGLLLLRYFDSEHEFTPEGQLVGWRAGNPGMLRVRVVSFLFRSDLVLLAQLNSYNVLAVEGGLDGVRAGRALSPALTVGWRLNETSEHDLIAQLGDPTVQMLTSQRDLVLVWLHIEWPTPRSTQRRTDALAVRLTEDGKLAEYSLTGAEKVAGVFP